jgi:hypothetical protein
MEDLSPTPVFALDCSSMAPPARSRKKRLITATLIAGSLIVLIGWYVLAFNYDYGTLAGVYVLDQAGERCVLSLRADHTFVEELSKAGDVQKSYGTWHRYGEAHVSFSQEFLRVSGQELNASGESHGEFEKSLGLFPVLTLAPLPNGPQFRRRLRLGYPQ